jgi:integrin beta 3
MNHSDIAALVAGFAPAIRDAIDEANTPLAARLAATEERNAELAQRLADLEQRAAVPGPQGEPGPPGRDGEDVDHEALQRAIVRAIDAAIAAIPPPADGKDGAPGRDGASVDPEHVRALVAEAVAALPKPADGKDGAPGRDGVDGKDGIGLAGALIDRGGVLVLTLTDGSVRPLGLVIGKDGADGTPGRDGRDGKDGLDGLSFMDAVSTLEGRTWTLQLINGDLRREWTHTLPIPIAQGTWQEGRQYQAHDEVTWGGSTWIAREDTTDKPGEGPSAWTLRTKRGRDGRDGKDGRDGERGPPGRDGRVT